MAGIIEVKQIAHLYEYIQSVIGQHVSATFSGDTLIDTLYTNELKNEQGLPIKAIVTDAINSVRAQRDSNHLEIGDYIYNIEQIMYHPNQLRVTRGKDVTNKELGTVLTINYVDNAESDHYNQSIHTYIKAINQYEPDTLTIRTGEQNFNGVDGHVFTINKVKDALNAVNDQHGNNISHTYANINHQHKIEDITNFKKYIEDNVISVINQLLLEGKIKIEADNTIEYCQFPKYDFDDDENVLITLSPNVKYNRPAPEILKLKNENLYWSNFTYVFDATAYSFNSHYISDKGKLIINKVIHFGPPRQLNNGYVSFSGIITNDNIDKINNIFIR